MRTIDIAFDYSLSCPAMCVDGKAFFFVNANDEFANEYVMKDMAVRGLRHSPWISRREKMSEASWHSTMMKAFLDEIQKLKSAGFVIRRAGFEDYALSKMGGGQNRLIQIAEATGTMKSICASMGIEVHKVPIGTAKKTAGKGNFKKEEMADAFHAEHGFYMHDLIGGDKGGSPASDVVDSYYIWKTLQSW